MCRLTGPGRNRTLLPLHLEARALTTLTESRRRVRETRRGRRRKWSHYDGHSSAKVQRFLVKLLFYSFFFSFSVNIWKVCVHERDGGNGFLFRLIYSAVGFYFWFIVFIFSITTRYCNISGVWRTRGNFVSCLKFAFLYNHSTIVTVLTAILTLLLFLFSKLR